MTAHSRRSPPQVPLFSIALLSAATLAYEILLIRLFSIVQWHHFAYMIISLALLGFGASGTFIAILRQQLLSRFELHYLLNLALFGLSALSVFLIAQQISFNPEEILWDPRQSIRLVAIYGLLTLPFFFAANAVGLALTRFGMHTATVYGTNLLGAGAGSVGIVLLLFGVFPMQALGLIAAAALLAAVVALWELRIKSWPGTIALLMLSGYPWLLPQAWVELQLSEYKHLSQTLRISGTRIIDQRSSPLGLVSVVESAKVPLRHAPGLSLNAGSGPSEQLALFTDGDGLSVVTRWDGESQLDYLRASTAALPYHLATPNSVLLLGAGGGVDALRALQLGAKAIDAVELNPQIIGLVRDDYATYAGDIYRQPGVEVHVAEARGFVTSGSSQYDLIELPLLDSSGAAAGLHALSENYLYTTEALAAFISRLAPGGYLSFTSGVRIPPRDMLKLFATAVSALDRGGTHDPESRLVLIRGWQTSTLLVKNGVFSPTEIARLRQFSKRYAFDLAYYPGIKPEEANRYNMLAEPYFYNGAQALLSNRAADYMQRYKFDIRPASDSRPYFQHFFKWSALPELLRLRDSGGLSLVESGYLVVVATLVQAGVLSTVLILLPLALYRREEANAGPAVRLRIFTYFLALGLAFLFLEIALIQKFILFLQHPLYSAAVVISSFLVFAGIGSLLSPRLLRLTGETGAVRLAVGAIVILGITYTLGLGPLFDALAALPLAWKITISTAVIAPLALCMGIPFPTALARLSQSASALVPWAWGINGCASVLSAVLATLLAIHFGFVSVVALALCLYGLAALSFNRTWC